MAGVGRSAFLRLLMKFAEIYTQYSKHVGTVRVQNWSNSDHSGTSCELPRDRHHFQSLFPVSLRKLQDGFLPFISTCGHLTNNACEIRSFSSQDSAEELCNSFQIHGYIFAEQLHTCL